MEQEHGVGECWPQEGKGAGWVTKASQWAHRCPNALIADDSRPLIAGMESSTLSRKATALSTR